MEILIILIKHNTNYDLILLRNKCKIKTGLDIRVFLISSPTSSYDFNQSLHLLM